MPLPLVAHNCTSADTSGGGPEPSFENRLDTAFSMEAAAGEVHVMSAVQRSATSSSASVIRITLQAHRVSVLAVCGHEQHSAANSFSAPPGCHAEAQALTFLPSVRPLFLALGSQRGCLHHRRRLPPTRSSGRHHLSCCWLQPAPHPKPGLPHPPPLHGTGRIRSSNKLVGHTGTKSAASCRLGSFVLLMLMFKGMPHKQAF